MAVEGPPLIAGREIPPAGFVLRIGAAPAARPLSVRPGEMVQVSVLRDAGAGRWLVSIRGAYYPARSTVPLTPGATHLARVVAGKGELTLRIQPGAIDIAQMLSEARLPADSFAREAASALHRSGLGVTADRLERLRDAFRAGEGGVSRKLRAGAEILRKLPDASPGDIALLSEVFSGNSDRQSQGRKHRRPRRETSVVVDPDAAAVRDGLLPDEPGAAPDGGRSGDLLRLFNHRRTAGESWVVLPCRFDMANGRTVTGSVRVCLDSVTLAVRDIVVEASRDGEPAWWFRLAGGDGQDSCAAWRDGAVDVSQARALAAQLGKIGVRLADTIGDGGRFDGFSAVEPLPGPVDLIG